MQLITDVKRNIRASEAKIAISALGIKANLHFLNLPFYYQRPRKASEADWSILRDLIQKVNPDSIFIAGKNIMIEVICQTPMAPTGNVCR